MIFERDLGGVPCLCGGYCDRADCTEEEIAEFGCGRDRPGMECCARAFVCRICGNRLAGIATAPEMD